MHSLVLVLSLLAATPDDASRKLPWDRSADGVSSAAANQPAAVAAPSGSHLAGSPSSSSEKSSNSSSSAFPAAAPAAAAASTGQPIRLNPPKGGRPADSLRPSGAASTGAATTTVVMSLCGVLALFFVTAWVFRRSAKGPHALPGEVIEVLGRTAFHGRQQLQLVRVGSKLLLVVVSPAGVETLTEISDPREVEQLVAACKQSQPGSVSETFRSILDQIGREKAPPGFVGSV